MHVLKLIPEKVDQGVWNLFKIENKDIKKEIVKIKASQQTKAMLIINQKKTWKKPETCYKLLIKKHSLCC